MYKHHQDFAGEVDHVSLVESLRGYDGWILHTNVPGLSTLLPLVGPSARCCAWVKPFAAFKRNVSVAYAWEPVFVAAARKPVVAGRTVMRDWFSAPITMKRGLAGAKPESVCRWLFELVGADPEDDVVDLFPGTGAVTRAWEAWRCDVLDERRLLGCT
jgi:hypothetical protein